MTDSDVRIVFISTPREEAAQFAKTLVDTRLAACVNIIPKMESYFRWEGKVQHDEEALLIVKTSAQTIEKLQEFVDNNHPYDLPEVISIPILEGLPAYLQWIRDESE